VSINVNSEQGRYFITFKGLRQGDPLSHPLFNLVVDALAAMLDLVKRRGRIAGLVSDLIDRGLTHLQYADDTVLMIQNKEESILNM
jgi:hypothetical protein